ncbi:MAG: sn-glycerol-3-phosphate ABC transporter ATP-binding protein UgpC [bacterium]|jgi:ABC-type sugar transport system ATPase subunit|nr:sn-glycerol-3-phosphate ABC transporter ATP-binding protein UgpC [bacterium]
MATIQLQQIGKRYPNGFQAVETFDLEIRDGEFLVLVGPSGCGKSTTLRMIAGLEEVSSGSILIDGRDVTQEAPANRDIAMVFQNYALYPHMSVKENMAFGLRMRKLPEGEIDRRVGEAAAILSVESLLDRRPRELSGGQRQRVALGRAIVRQPKAFLFDEPLSNLDAKLRVQMRTEIARLHTRLGTTMVYVTHDQVEAMTLGDRIVVMNQGRIQQVDSPMVLYQRPSNRFVAGFIGSPAMNFLPGEVGHGGFTPQGAMQPLALGRDLPAGPALLGIRPESLDLDPALPLLAEVELDVVEHMGHETLAYFVLGGQACVARLVPAAGLAPGRRVRLGVKATGWHFFAHEGEQHRLDQDHP